MTISDKVSMFYNAKPHIFEKAKALRENMTAAELKLWEFLKGKKVLGLRFRPQHPIDIFIADFYCHPLKLIIEVDGEIHRNIEQLEYDAGRTGELNNWGIDVIRFTNNEIENDFEFVKQKIVEECRRRLNEQATAPPLTPKGEPPPHQHNKPARTKSPFRGLG
jgi:very-short-patch-repair endonuclease